MTTKATKAERAATRAAAMKEAYTIQGFCDAHGISLRFYYTLRERGEAPEEMAVARRVLISKEAAARWRAERESERMRRRAAR